MNTKDPLSDVFSSLGEISTSLGFNRLTGQIYGLLYFSGRPVSMEEITSTLKTTKGNVSVNIRELERLSAVRRTKQNGSRKTYFTAENDFMSIAKTHFGLAIRKRMKLAEEFMAKMEEATKKTGPGKENAVLSVRLGEIKKNYETVAEFIKSFIQ